MVLYSCSYAMKPSFVVSPNPGRVAGERGPCWHRWIPAVLVGAYAGCFIVWPLMQDIRALILFWVLPVIGYDYWFSLLGLPREVHIICGLLLTLVLFSLPWASVLTSSFRGSMFYTLGVVVLFAAQASGCHLQTHKGQARSSFSIPGAPLNPPSRLQNRRA